VTVAKTAKKTKRRVTVVSSSIGDLEQGDITIKLGQDGCEVTPKKGNPKKVAKAIADVLESVDVTRGPDHQILENGGALYLHLTLKIEPKKVK
jgi:hypothetical protein